MTRLDVIYSDDALSDLESILDYIVEQSGFVSTAERHVERIMSRCELIGDAPESGVLRRDFGTSMRLVPFDHVVIVYDAQPHRVFIVRIFGGSQDYDTLMRK